MRAVGGHHEGLSTCRLLDDGLLGPRHHVVYGWAGAVTADRQRQAAEVLLSTLYEGNPLYYEDAADDLAAALAPLIGQRREQDRAEGAAEALAGEAEASDGRPDAAPQG
jgi:hypothetical protein